MCYRMNKKGLKSYIILQNERGLRLSITEGKGIQIEYYRKKGNRNIALRTKIVHYRRKETETVYYRKEGRPAAVYYKKKKDCN